MKPEDLKQIAVLESLTPDALTRLAAALEEKSYPEGVLIFAEGDAPDAMYFIQEGCIRVQKRTQAEGSAQKTLAVLETGDYFGEMALFEQKPRSASTVAVGQVKVLRLSKVAFDNLHKNTAQGLDVLAAMIRTSSERLRRMSTEVIVYDEIGKAIGESPDLRSLSEVILQQLVPAAQGDWGLLLICSEFCDRFELCASVNLSLTSAQREAISGGAGFPGLIRKNPTDLLVDDFNTEDSFKSCTRIGFETPAMLVAAITVARRFLGLILIGGHERGQFHPNQLNLARGIARQAAQAILNARHREEENARSRHARQFVRF